MLGENGVPVQVQAIPEDLIAQLTEAVCRMARRYERSGRPQEGVRLLESALAFGKQDQHSRDRAMLLASLGGIIWKQGRYPEALALLQRAKGLAEAARCKRALAVALYHLGELAYVRAFLMQEGDLRDALVYHQRCLALRQEMADLPGITLSLSRIGVLYERLGEYDEAQIYHRQAIELAGEIDYAPGLVRPYNHLGGALRRKGDLRGALVYYQQALDVAHEAGLHGEIVFGLLNTGWAQYRLGGDFQSAWCCLQRALEMAESSGFKLAIGRAYYALAEFCASEGRTEQARCYFEKLARLSAGAGYRLQSGLAKRRIKELEGLKNREAKTRRSCDAPRLCAGVYRVQNAI